MFLLDEMLAVEVMNSELCLTCACGVGSGRQVVGMWTQRTGGQMSIGVGAGQWMRSVENCVHSGARAQGTAFLESRD